MAKSSKNHCRQGKSESTDCRLQIFEGDSVPSIASKLLSQNLAHFSEWEETVRETLVKIQRDCRSVLPLLILARDAHGELIGIATCIADLQRKTANSLWKVVRPDRQRRGVGATLRSAEHERLKSYGIRDLRTQAGTTAGHEFLSAGSARQRGRRGFVFEL